MIKLETIDLKEQHLLVSADEPVRVEIQHSGDIIFVQVYKGVECDLNQPAICGFDGSFVHLE